MKGKRRPVWDRLTFERETEEKARYYKGSRGTYLFLMNGTGNPCGRVILNRQYLTALYQPKYSAPFRRYVGDLKGERKFLIFDKVKPDQILITWAERKKD